MIALMTLFAPAVLAVWCYEVLSKQNLQKKHWLYRFTLDWAGINLVCFFVKDVLLHYGDVPLYTFAEDMVPSVSLHYLIVAVPVGLIFTLLQVFLRKTVKITVEDTPHG